MSEHQAKAGLRLLKEVSMQKINFAGGEPFLYKPFLGHMIEFCKMQLKLDSVSIVTNGSLITQKWLEIDILAVSCDSFDEATNVEIGRGYRQYGIKFKLNTVVNRLNFEEDMVATVEQLNPFRWKAFQVLMVAGENDSETTLRDVRKFQISDEELGLFCKRHGHLRCFVPEPNSLMATSYLILDEYMRFLGRKDGKNQASRGILEVGVKQAMREVFWDKESFEARALRDALAALE
ncbi:hypothetical protein H2199_001903 [Coniosporium tulheliwenetii]|uniref:Uncharacterized protein n=1 Tax=Coniosporium tulheliwenetii TaxID=3383036 RepID=A0ACC2ZKP2_9PEZI|nr:hypothetical protein H2199_001903 [Cladosporium sp. JES 115]